MTRERWKAVLGFDAYEVSDLGRIRRVKRGQRTGAPLKVLKPWPGVGGERFVSLRSDGRSYACCVAALVDAAFGGHQGTSSPSMERQDG